MIGDSRNTVSDAVNGFLALPRMNCWLLFWNFNPRSLFDLISGCCWMDLNKFLKAVEIFRKGVEVAGDDPYGLILQAQLQWALGNIKKSWWYADQAVKASPSDARALHFRGFIQALKANNESDKASQQSEVDDYIYILEKIPDYSRISIIHSNLGYVYYEMKNYTKALEHFDASVALCPHHVQTYYNKAVCLGDQGRIEEAAAICQKMVEINPRHPDSYSLRGWVHIGLGELSKSVALYRTALEYQEGKDFYTMIIYTGGLCVLNRFDEAYEAVNRVLPGFEAQAVKLAAKIEAASAREVERAEQHGQIPQTKVPGKCSCKAFIHPDAVEPPRSEATDLANVLGDNGEILMCPTDVFGLHKDPNSDGVYDGPDSEMENINYWKSKLVLVKCSLTACYRVLAEIDLSIGKFDRVPELYGKFKSALSGLCRTSVKRQTTPLTLYCSTLNFERIGPEVIELVKAYHKFRESENSESSFNELKTLARQSTASLNEDEQLYYLACISHYVRHFICSSSGKHQQPSL